MLEGFQKFLSVFSFYYLIPANAGKI